MPSVLLSGLRGQTGAMAEELSSLQAGMAVPYGGDRVARVTEELAAAFRSGDRLVVVQTTGDLLHVPAAAARLVDDAMGAASEAFAQLALQSDDAISTFYESFATRLADQSIFEAVAEANAVDVAVAREAGRSTTRLELSAKMRSDMISGLRLWRDAPATRDRLAERIEHDGWTVEQRHAPLGVVGFVFEGRPNVCADATGVLRGGNPVVFRIGSDALGTARAIVRHALDPALAEAGLHPDSVRLLDSASRATGWALFGHPGLALAVARGSGKAVEQLGAVARQSGIPVSLHGTGGGWLIAGRAADPARLEAALFHSLDRKVCNTTNVVAVPPALVEPALRALGHAAERLGLGARLHVERTGAVHLDTDWLARAELLDQDDLGVEWEWDDIPEITLLVVATPREAVELFNRYSPRLVASLISDNAAEQDWFWQAVDAPFVGDGFTRWVDGQYALGRPELGLSNWANGRLFARSAVLSGDSVFTVRTRARQRDPNLHR